MPVTNPPTCAPSYTADLLGTSQRRRATKQLNKEPEDEIKYGWNLEKEWEKEDWKQNNESRRRKKHQIRTEHARDRARGAYRWKRRIRICQQLREASDAAAEQIEVRKSDRSHPVLHIVAENPERPHVGDDVEPAAMKELIREDRPVTIYGKTNIGSPVRMSEARRHNSKEIKELFDAMRAQHQLEEENERVDQNQCMCNYRHGAARNRVLNWKHLGT